jgi:hypothetical protein
MILNEEASAISTSAKFIKFAAQEDRPLGSDELISTMRSIESRGERIITKLNAASPENRL